MSGYQVGYIIILLFFIGWFVVNRKLKKHCQEVTDKLSSLSEEELNWDQEVELTQARQHMKNVGIAEKFAIAGIVISLIGAAGQPRPVARFLWSILEGICESFY